MAAYLSTFKSSSLTWYYKADIKNLFNPASWTDSDAWKKQYPKQYDRLIEGFSTLNRNAPYILDCNIKEATLIPDDFPITGYPNDHNKSTHPLDPKSELLVGSIEDFYNDCFVFMGFLNGKLPIKTYQIESNVPLNFYCESNKFQNLDVFRCFDNILNKLARLLIVVMLYFPSLLKFTIDFV